MHSDLMPIIYRAQRSRQSYVEPLIDISQEWWPRRRVVVRFEIDKRHYFVSRAGVDCEPALALRLRQRRSNCSIRCIRCRQ